MALRPMGARYRRSTNNSPGWLQVLITAIDYFIKWVEAEPLVVIEDSDVKRFGWRNIVSRFNAPHAIIVDNVTQFVGSVFSTFCEEHDILLLKATPHYPKSNRQAESSNKTVANGIKRHLRAKKGKWAEGLYHVLWAYRTTPR